MDISPLQKARYEYQPKLPGMLRNGIAEISVQEGAATQSVADQEKIKALMREDKFITIGQMAQRLQMSESGIEKAIRILRKNEEVNRKGGRFGGEWEVLK